MSNSEPPEAAGFWAGSSAGFSAGAESAGVSKSEPPEDLAGAESAGASKSDEPPEASAAAPTSSVLVTVDSVWVTSPAAGSALVATDFFASGLPTRVATSPFTDARTICATSRTSTSSRGPPLVCSEVRSPHSITRQNGGREEHQSELQSLMRN